MDKKYIGLFRGRQVYTKPDDQMIKITIPESLASYILELQDIKDKKEKLMFNLKPCPFCGGRAAIEDLGWPHHVYCTKCGAKVMSCKFEKDGELEAIEKWNRRVDDD